MNVMRSKIDVLLSNITNAKIDVDEIIRNSTSAKAPLAAEGSEAAVLTALGENTGGSRGSPRPNDKWSGRQRGSEA